MSEVAITEQEEQVRLMTKIAIMSIAANALLGLVVIALLYSFFTKKVEAYGLMDDGRAIPLVPLSAEYLTESRVNAFAAECLRKAFEHDFEHYKGSVQEATSCFTGTGVDSYVQQITPLVKNIVAKRMVMSISVAAPVVVRKGLANGAFEWQVQVPVTVFMIGVAESIPPAKYLATVAVRRVPLVENVRGISLSYINLAPRS